MDVYFGKIVSISHEAVNIKGGILMRDKMRKYASIFLVFCMVLGLFAEVPVNAADVESGTENATGELVATTYFDWLEDGPVVHENAEYQRELYVSLMPCTMHLAYRADADAELQTVTAEKISVTYEGEAVNELVRIWANEQNADYVDMEFQKTGDYVVNYTDNLEREYSLIIHVVYPEMGFYTQPSISDETILSRFAFSDMQTNTFYLIMNPAEGCEMQLDDSVPFFVCDYELGYDVTDSEEVKKYVTYEAVEENVYRITVSALKNFEVRAQAEVISETDTWQNECCIGVFYEPKMEGLVVKEWIDWNEEGPYVSDEATFSKEAWAIPKEDKIVYLAYVETEGGEDTPVTAEDITITYNGEDAGERASCSQNRENTDLINLQFQELGEYAITYSGDGNKDKSVKVTVDYPEVGFYYGEERNIENLIANGRFVYSDVENVTEKTFYVIMQTKGTSIALNEAAPFKINDYQTGIESSEPEVVAEYISYERVEGRENVYRIIVNTPRNFGLNVEAIVVDGDGNEWVSSNSMNVEYEQKMEGLVVKDWIEWNEEGPYISEEASFSKETWCDLNGHTIYLAYLESEEDTTPEVVHAEDLTITYNGEAADEIVNVADNELNGDLIGLRFTRTGEYIVTYKAGTISKTITIHVDYPMAGFYRTAEVTDEGYIRDELLYEAGENQEFYLILLDRGEEHISDTQIHVLDYYSDAIEVEMVEENHIYKIVIRDTWEAQFRIQASFLCRWGDGEPDLINYELSLRDEDLTGRSAYIDGAKHTGYSGCFMTKEEYEFGGIYWDNNSPIYYVHADTVQGVIDKLLRVANGEEVLYRSVIDEETGKMVQVSSEGLEIENTGYIQIVVSNFGNVTLTPEYVTSAGDLKGISFVSGQDVYMTEHEPEDGIYIEDQVYSLERLRGALIAEGITQEEMAHMIPDALAEESYVSIYQNEIYFVEEIIDEEKAQRYFVLGEAVTYDTGMEAQQKQLLLEAFADNVFAELMEPSRYPEMHVNTYCDMTFGGGFDKLWIGFKEGYDYSATIVNGNEKTTFTREDLAGQKTKECEAYTIYWDDRTQSGHEEVIPIRLYEIEEVTNTSGNYEGAVSVDEMPEPNAMEELTTEQKDAIEQGKKLTVDVKADSKNETEVGAAVAESMKSVVKNTGFAGIVYLDLSVLVSVEGVTGATQITEMKTSMVLTIEIPERIRKDKRKYKIVRYHEKDGKGHSEELDASVSGDGKRITFKTDRFSTYAIVYDSVEDENAGATQTPGTSTTPDTTQKPDVPAVVVGSQQTVDGNKYTVTNVTDGAKTVVYNGSTVKGVKVTVPATVTIGGAVYSVTEIADGAFAGNTKLTNVTLPKSIVKIGKNAFKGCTKLKKITIPKNVTAIGANAFYNCKKLGVVKFGTTKLAAIGQGAFGKCSSLKSVTIPKSVTEIGKDAFKNCKNLKKVTIKGTKLKKIGKNAFKNNAKKITIKVPRQKKSAYKKLLKKAGYKKTVK